MKKITLYFGIIAFFLIGLLAFGTGKGGGKAEKPGLKTAVFAVA